MFFDEAEVVFISGTGGSGAVAFHTEKHVPRGGPNGADGGRGGSIYLQAERGCRTLYDVRLREKFVAENGIHATGNKRGKSSKDLIVKVPVGTVVTDGALNEVLCDLNVHGMKYLIAHGGRGGHGNLHYVSSIRQVPNFAEKGEPGETVRAKLEMKLLADVGLIGLPNAGKSTLLSTISAAKPKIADYPFTTIIPNLGVARIDEQSFVVADMPGLIEGASTGHGLGHQFLKHIERTRVLIHVVDIFPIDGSDPIENYHLIETELKEYSEEVYSCPRIIALNKIDMVPTETFHEVREKFEALGIPLFPISAATQQGITPLLYETAAILKRVEDEAPAEIEMPATERPRDDFWDVIPAENGGFELVGRRIRRLVAMTNLNSKDAVRYLHRRLARLGVIDRLKEMGADEGDTVFVDNHVFAFTEGM